MSQKVTVDKCAELGNGRFMITYRGAGAAKCSAISTREHREGETVVVKEGKVIG